MFKVYTNIEARNHEKFEENCPQEIRYIVLIATSNDPNSRPTAQMLYDRAKAIETKLKVLNRKSVKDELHEIPRETNSKMTLDLTSRSNASPAPMPRWSSLSSRSLDSTVNTEDASALPNLSSVPPNSSSVLSKSTREALSKICSEASRDTLPISFRSQKMYKTYGNIYAVKREAFCWLDDTNVVVNPYDGRQIGLCIILNTSTGEVRSVEVGETVVTSVARLTENKFVTGNEDGTISLFKNGKHERTRKLASCCCLVKFISNEIVVAPLEADLVILNENLEIVKKYHGAHGKPVSISGNAKFIVVGYQDGVVRCYNKEDSQESWSYRHKAMVTTVSVQGNRIASGSRDKAGSTQVWSIESKKILWHFQHDDQVNCVQLHDNWLITSSDDESVRIWDLNEGTQIHKLRQSGCCNNFDISPNKSLMAIASYFELVLVDLSTKETVEEFSLGTEINDVRFNKSGKRLVAGLHNGEVFKVDLLFNSEDETDL